CDGSAWSLDLSFQQLADHPESRGDVSPLSHREITLLRLAIDHRENDDAMIQEAGVADPVGPSLASPFARRGEADFPQPARTRDDRVAVRPVEDRGLEGRQVAVTQTEGRPRSSEAGQLDELRPLRRVEFGHPLPPEPSKSYY